MSVELRPLGVLCNIRCHYCYQEPQRAAGNVSKAYDLNKMKAALEQEGRPFTLFGGEPLLLPLPDLEQLWAWGYKRFRKNTVQTNGTLITDNHIRLFRQYNVHVGISLDGPGPLNDVRWCGDLAKTRASTAKSEAAITRLCREKLIPSLIVTLHRGNAAADRLPTLVAWIRQLADSGVRHVGLHLLENDNGVSAAHGLTTDENVQALRAFLDLERQQPELRFDTFPEIRRLLMGDDRRTTCVWRACDPYTTSAVRGVEGHGQRSNCGRTNKVGVDFVKSATPGYERYAALYHTPYEAGGCNGCRFFLMCKGQCPGTAIDNDWRNRTEHCGVWKAIFQTLEQELQSQGKLPLSQAPERPRIEERAVALWAQGQQVSLALLTGLADRRE